MLPIIGSSSPPVDEPGEQGEIRVLSGAALHSRIERQLRDQLSREWGLPIHEYTARVDRDGQWEGPYFEGGPRRFIPFPSHTVTFTRGEDGAEVVVTQIYTDDAGEILQLGTQYGALTL